MWLLSSTTSSPESGTLLSKSLVYRLTPQAGKMEAFMLKEARYAQLAKLKGKEEADAMFKKAAEDAKRRRDRLVAIEKEGL